MTVRKTPRPTQQLRNNVERMVGEYLNGQMDHGEDEYPNMTESEWLDYCIPSIYNMKDNGKGATVYAKGICDNLKWLGSKRIEAVVLEVVRNEGLLAS